MTSHPQVTSPYLEPEHLLHSGSDWPLPAVDVYEALHLVIWGGDAGHFPVKGVDHQSVGTEKSRAFFLNFHEHFRECQEQELQPSLWQKWKKLDWISQQGWNWKSTNLRLLIETLKAAGLKFPGQIHGFRWSLCGDLQLDVSLWKAEWRFDERKDAEWWMAVRNGGMVAVMDDREGSTGWSCLTSAFIYLQEKTWIKFYCSQCQLWSVSCWHALTEGSSLTSIQPASSV